MIRADDLNRPEIPALLQEHLAFAALHTPPECMHALELDADIF